MGTTEVRLAETGLTFGGEIPENMRHIGEPIDVYNSRVRAGLVERSTSSSLSVARPMGWTSPSMRPDRSSSAGAALMRKSAAICISQARLQPPCPRAVSIWCAAGLICLANA